MLEGGADIRYIQAMLGHAELSTTQIYTQVSIRALQAVHAATFPASIQQPPRRAPGLVSRTVRCQSTSATAAPPESVAASSCLLLLTPRSKKRTAPTPDRPTARPDAAGGGLLGRRARRTSRPGPGRSWPAPRSPPGHRSRPARRPGPRPTPATGPAPPTTGRCPCPTGDGRTRPGRWGRPRRRSRGTGVAAAQPAGQVRADVGVVQVGPQRGPDRVRRGDAVLLDLGREVLPQHPPVGQQVQHPPGDLLVVVAAFPLHTHARTSDLVNHSASRQRPPRDPAPTTRHARLPASPTSTRPTTTTTSCDSSCTLDARPSPAPTSTVRPSPSPRLDQPFHGRSTDPHTSCISGPGFSR